MCLSCLSPQFSSDANAKQTNVSAVPSLPLLGGIYIKYFIYQACSLPPPVSHALPIPPNANKTLAPHVIEQHDASSKCVQQMSLISWDRIWEEWINKTSASKYRWRRWRGGRKRRGGGEKARWCSFPVGLGWQKGHEEMKWPQDTDATCAPLLWIRRETKWNKAMVEMGRNKSYLVHSSAIMWSNSSCYFPLTSGSFSC